MGSIVPELPEVEVTRLSFADRIRGASILAVSHGKPLRWPFGIGLDNGAQEACDILCGSVILSVRRRGKYLLIDTQRGEETGLLLIHLGMSGSLFFGQHPEPLGQHDHFSMLTSFGELRLNDPRRFGAVVFAYSESDTWPSKLLGRLGAEPLSAEFDADSFFVALKLRRSPIKQVLLAGDLVVGVGNIYASEALFLAGIRPTVLACDISRARALRLHASIVQVLTTAVAHGGSTLRDFSSAAGERGYFQLQANVYGRAGQSCLVCLTPIKTIRQVQRSTFFCPHCQKP